MTPAEHTARPGVYYAAVKWAVDAGPDRSVLRNDFEILAMTLVAEHGWRADDVDSVLSSAIDAAYEQEREIEEQGA